MKKHLSILSILLCLILCLSLMACEVEETAPASDDETSSQTTVETTSELATESTLGAETASATESIGETLSETPTESATESISETDTESATESAFETDTESVTESTSETDTESVAESISETLSETPTESATETTTETESATETTYTVTEEQWKNAFSSDNATLNYKSGSIVQIFNFDGNKVQDYMEYFGEGFTMFFEFEIDDNGNEIWWEYAESAFEGDWAKYLDEEGNGRRMFDVINSNFRPFAHTFGSFRYDEEAKAYVSGSVKIMYEDSSYTYTDAVAKFENGRLIEFSYRLESTVFTITNVGTTTVTIPTIKYEVTEDEWKAIMTSDDLKNLRIEGHGTAKEDEDFIGHRILECTENGSVIYDLHGVGFGNYRGAIKKDGVWYKVDMNEDYEFIGVATSEDEIIATCYFAGLFGAQLSENFDKFTFDAENNCYVATDYTLGDKECDEVKIYIRNGKIVMVEETGVETIDGDALTVTYVYEFSRYGRVTEEHIYLPDFEIHQ